MTSPSEISQDLLDEITSINSIYSEDTLKLQQPPDPSDSYKIEYGEAVCILSPPSSEIDPRVSLTLKFPKDYPALPPTIMSGTTFGKGLSREEVTQLARDVLWNVWLDDSVVLFDLLEGLKERLRTQNLSRNSSPPESARQLQVSYEEVQEITSGASNSSSTSAPAAVTDVSTIPWTITPSTTVSKSIFVGRCVPVTSAETAKQYVAELISTNKKVAKATHNITAFRIRTPEGLIYKDNDDDGETAAGSRLAHLLDLIDVWNVLVVVSRWYGGVKLGPDRFRIINQVAREALVQGNFIDEHGHTKGEDTGDGGKSNKKKKGKHH